jgi:hypothetical protein
VTPDGAQGSDFSRCQAIGAARFRGPVMETSSPTRGCDLTRHFLGIRPQTGVLYWPPANRRHSSTFTSEYSAVTKLYVGNLPFTATEEGVRALFSAHGTVEKVSLITDRDTGRPRGFGFVEMSNADASRAMQALNGKDFEGRALKVNEAQDRERSGGGGHRGGPRRY